MDLEQIEQWVSAAQAALGRPLSAQYCRNELSYGIRLRGEDGAEVSISEALLPPLDAPECSEVIREAFCDGRIELALQEDGSGQGPWRRPVAQAWQGSPFAARLWHDAPVGAAGPLQQVRARRAAVEAGTVQASEFMRHFSGDTVWQREQDHGWVGLAASAGPLQSVRVLLEAGLGPNLSYKGRAPLDWALQNGTAPMVLLLLGAGANPEGASAADADGHTLLCKAVQKNDLVVVGAFLAAGSDPARPSPGGRRPLHFAQSPEMVQSLLAAGADVNAIDQQGQTALHEACRLGREDVVWALVDAGASLVMENDAKAIPSELIPGNCDELFEKLESRRAGPLAQSPRLR